MSLATGKGPPVWAWDVDGVLARFNEAALAWLNDRYRGAKVGLDWLVWPYGEEGPTTWNWPREMFGRRAEDKFWEMVQANPRWWLGLKPYDDAFATLQTIERQMMENNVVPYFVTSRPPNNAQMVTQTWLQNNGIYRPNVVVVQPGKKHLVLEAIGAQVLVDDYVENFHDLPPFTRGYIVDRSWNRAEPTAPNVHRVKSPLDVFVYEAPYAGGRLEGHR